MTQSEAPAGRVDEPTDGLVLASAAGRWVLLATILGSAIATIDGTIVSIALPSIGRDLGASFAGLQWTITGYTITLAALILLGGAAGDQFGRRRVFLIGTVWFAIASALCATAPTIETLIAARVVQGIGGALLTPASLAVLQSVFRPEDRGPAVGTWAGFSGIAAALAPFLGGWILDLGSWRWVFVVNLPLAAVVVALSLRHMPESCDEESERRRLDYAGAAATVCFLAGLTYALIEAPSGRRQIAVVVAGVVAASGLAAFLQVERSSRAPLLSLELFRIRQFSAANASTFVVYGGLGLFFLLLVLQLQVVVGWSPLGAGAASIPVTVLVLAFSRLSGRLAGRIGPRVQMSVGPLICAVAILLALRIHSNADYVRDVLPVVVVFGIGLATLVAPLTATALASVPGSHAGVASGFNNAVARTGALLAIAAVPALTGLTGDAITDPHTFSAGFRSSMIVCAALMVGGAAISAVGIRNTPRVTGNL